MERPLIYEEGASRSIPEKTEMLVFFGIESVNAGATLEIPSLSLSLPLTLIHARKARVQLPNTISKGRYDVFAQNTDGSRTPNLQIEFHSNLSAINQDGSTEGNRYMRDVLDQRVFILPTPFAERTDTQRVLAGNQFAGEVPDAEQGKFGDVAGPTKGGRWAYNDDVTISMLEFKSSAAEARAAGSGWYIKRGGSSEYREIDLEPADQSVTFNEAIPLRKGDTLYLRTYGATLEMQASVTIKPRRVGPARF